MTRTKHPLAEDYGKYASWRISCYFVITILKFLVKDIQQIVRICEKVDFQNVLRFVIVGQVSPENLGW